MPDPVSLLLQLLVLCLVAGLQGTLPSDKFCVLRCYFVELLSLLLVLLELGLQHLDLPVLILNHFGFALGVFLSLSEFLHLRLGCSQFLKQAIFLFFTAHQAHVEVVLFLAFLVQNSLLFVQGFL